MNYTATPLLITSTRPLPQWLPDHVRARLAGKAVAFDLPRPVRMRLRHPEKIRVSEWAEKFRVVTDGAHGGPWRHDYAPHTVKIMDTFGLPWVREVWFCGVEQSGKTNTMLNCIGWAIDCDPGNIFYLMPTENASDKVVGEKIKPTLQKSPRLSRYLGKKQDDTTLDRIRLNHGVTLLPAWANSPSSMAMFAAKHCFGDEVDKYPAMAGKETDPITLIKKRNLTYKGRFKRFFSSTPAGVFIYKGMQNCHQVWEFRVKCPDCGDLVKMDAGYLVLPSPESRVTSPEDIERNGVDYACHCGSIWDDRIREEAIRNGRWLCVKGDDISRPAKVGFHHRAWECLDITLAEIGAAWLRAQQGGVAEKTAWANGYEAIDYEAETVGQIEEETILKFRSEVARGLVPPDTARLGLLVDTQQSSFYYELWALGYSPTIDLHMVKHGIVETFEDIEGLLAADYQDHAGNAYRITGGLIDSGGTRRGWQKHSRTFEVYEWCARNRIMMPFKGISGRTGDMVSFKQLATFPNSNKPIPGGLKRVNLRVDVFKDDLERRLAKEPDDPGALSFHGDIDAAFAKHFTSESRDENGDWVHNKNKGRNDYFDCAVYALALRELLKLRIPRKTEQGQPTGRRILSKGVNNA